MSIETGGPAFPTENERQTGHNSFHYEGMTLRDYFAAKAMQGDWAAQNSRDGAFPPDTRDERLRKTARLYYRMADAMLAERNK